MKKELIHGRGAQSQQQNRFSRHEVFDLPGFEGRPVENLKTKYIPVFPKTIVNKVQSPDVPMPYSANPYQGCEHGCAYCYARPTHEYWGYNAGLDFESVILVKKNAPELLENELRKKNWQVGPVMLSGNTDCYQPAERKFGITRKMLEVFDRFHHPVSIITKASLICRDIDILSGLSGRHLTSVALSITSSNDEVRKRLEPRAGSIESRFQTMEKLAKAGIRVVAMIGPVIPSINDQDIPEIIKRARSHGASDVAYVVVRLNDVVGEVFREWIEHAFPDRAKRVIKQIKDLHGGTAEDYRKGIRMRGEGIWAKSIKSQFQTFKKKYFSDIRTFEWNLDDYDRFKNPQMKLFE